MRPVVPMPIASAALVIAVVAIAALLAWRQWREHQHREDDLSAEDAEHFARQDRRRVAVVSILLILAAGIAIGSRLAHLAMGGRDRALARVFAWTWIGVILLVFALLGLAWSDWTANLRYARRHRRAIADERRAFLDDLRRRRAYPGNGQGDPEGPLGRSPLA